jgi:prefoldin subunit 5
MKEELLKDITSSISEKLGEENASIIADDIGKLITANTQTIETIESLKKEVSTLEDTRDKLVRANASLLQQIPAVADYEKHQEAPVEEEKKAFNFKSMFDKHGNFRKDL